MSYAHPEAIVTTEWVQEHHNDPKVRVVEVDYDPTINYQLGHIPGAVLFDWRKDLNHPLQRDIPTREQLEALFNKSGISSDTKIVLYGDFNNWFAATSFKVSTQDDSLRVYLRQALDLYNKPNVKLVDVRGPKEFSGEILAPPEYPTEHAQRGGHIPGAVNIPWSQAVKEDGTFKTYEDIKKLYESQGVTADKDVVAYCRIGERSSFTWFVLKYLLGYPKVRNYDGSWTEWGNLVRNPIEKPVQAQPVTLPA